MNVKSCHLYYNGQQKNARRILRLNELANRKPKLGH